MEDIEVYTITQHLKLIDLSPPIDGYQKFFGTYVIQGDRIAIIDTGPRTAVPKLLSALEKLEIAPSEVDYIILTHIHIDHAGGVGTALKEMKKAKVIAHNRARPHLIDPSRLWQASLKTLGKMAIEFGEIEPVPEHKIIIAIDLMKIDFGPGLIMELYLTPGHAPHHISLFDKASKILIAGEAAGVYTHDTIRPATPPPFKIDEAIASIDRLIKAGPEKICYGHFGCYGNAAEKLKLIRQKLLSWHTIVNSAVKAKKNPEEILAVLKEEDNSLDYLDKLEGPELNREVVFLINSIRGLSST